MGGKAWSQEDLIRLEELTEKYPLSTVARILNRSENAVFLKRQRLGIGGIRDNSDMLTRNTLSRILGVENRTIQYWERTGLKSIRKKPYVMYRHQDIINYLRDHPEDWNATRVTDDTLFMRYKWYKEKRKNDISRKYNWTQTEVNRMNMLRKQGFTIREIAEKMNRSESSIKYKMYGREKSNGRNQNLATRPNRDRRHPADADEEKHPKRASGMEPGKMSDLRTGMLETNVKTGDPAEENASSLHRVRTQNRK